MDHLHDVNHIYTLQPTIVILPLLLEMWCWAVHVFHSEFESLKVQHGWRSVIADRKWIQYV